MAMDSERILKLDLIHAFGSSTSKGFRDCLGITQEDGVNKLIFPVGKYIAIKRLDDQEMEFQKLSENLQHINCIAIAPNKKSVAVCE